jgi:hypothetical protein
MNSVSKKNRTDAPYGGRAYGSGVRVLLLLIVTMLAAGCGGSGSGGQGRSGSTGPAPTSGTTPAPSSSNPGTANPNSPSPGAAVPASVLEQVKAQAAQRAGVDVSQVEIVSSTVRTWNDGSLGCPEPGMNYIQVISEGYQIIVRAGGRTYDFRTSPRAIKVCGQ